MAVVDIQRLAEGVDDPASNLFGFGDGVEILEHDSEFVATQSRDGVLRPDRALKPGSSSAQDAIAGGMAERIVDVLEAVEVEEQHGDALALPTRAHDRAR